MKTNKDNQFAYHWASELIHDMDYADTVVFKNGCFVSQENGNSIYEIIRPLRITDTIQHEIIGNIYTYPHKTN